MRKVGLIGFGAIGAAIVEAWPRHLGSCASLCALLVRREQVGVVVPRVPQGTFVTADLNDFLDRGVEVVIEAAGHGAATEYARPIVERGCQIYLLSAGALADEALRIQLLAAAERGGGRIIIPAGALGGFDGLLSLRAAGLISVKYTSVKPIGAWRRTAAEDAFRLDDLVTPQVVFSGSASEAARTYPRNANLAAAVAVAGIGFDATRVELIADPGVTENSARIEAVSLAGRLDVTLISGGFAENPKSSRITAMSAIAALRDRNERIGFC
jgi:aspartate dehydrogenase